ncbi:MAG TPA: hypothetical protein VF957_23415 [Bradyrhizobium sp.]
MTNRKPKHVARLRTIVCSNCGSDDVRRDATASWNIETQAWELSAVQDQGYCQHCQGEASLVELIIDPSAPSLPEIEPPEEHRLTGVDELESKISNLPGCVYVSEAKGGYRWGNLAGRGKGPFGPFRNKRSALADCFAKHPGC